MISAPKVITSVSEMVQWRRKALGSIGFVPTMGALHEGHATLLRQSKSRSRISVLSIFINPTQFGPNEDLSKYPRTLEKDLKIAAREGVDVVFAPTPLEIYPSGYSTFIEEIQASQPLCGVFRPGHFKGVTTIVLKLLNLVRPETAYFGLKDAQQFFVLKKMVEDLNLDVKLEGVPTIREPDGLALSSRNIYLTAEEREKAPLIHQALQKIERDYLNEQDRSIGEILKYGRSFLEENGFQVQYLDCLKLPEMLPLEEGHRFHPEFSYLTAVAAYLGKTRLIDNRITG